MSSKDLSTGTVWVARGWHHPSLFRWSLEFDVSLLNWTGPPAAGPVQGNGPWAGAPVDAWRLSEARSEAGLPVTYRIRHAQVPRGRARLFLPPSSSASASSSSGSVAPCYGRLELELPQRAVAPGQVVVLYDSSGRVCLGGAPIANRGETLWEQGVEQVRPVPEEHWDRDWTEAFARRGTETHRIAPSVEGACAGWAGRLEAATGGDQKVVFGYVE